MAQDSIIGGLFGLTPEMYQRSQAEEDQKAAMQFAQLSPLQQASAGFYSAGMGLGRGIGTLLGAEDPQLRMIAQQQQILKNVDMNNPESIAQASKVASEMGIPRLAMALGDLQRKALESQSLVAQRVASATRERTQETPTSIQEAQYISALKRNLEKFKALPEETEGRSEAIANFTAQLSALEKPEKQQGKTELQKLLDELATLDSVKDKQRINTINKRIEIITTREPKTQVNVNLAQEKEFEKELGQQQAKDIIKSRSLAESAANSLQTMSQAKDILSRPIFTGPMADFQAQFGSLLQSVGVRLETDAVANTQAYGALMAKQTAEIIKSFGAGTGLSDADREYALKAAGGNVKMDKDALKRIININETAARNIILLHNKKVKGIKTNIPLEVELPSTGWRIYK